MKAIYRYFLVTLLACTGISSRAQSIKDSIIVPNIFTPNADGLNDVFKPVLAFESKIQSYKLEVYDRFGIKLMETSKHQYAWDGRSTSGMPCPDGTYFYSIQLSINGSKFEHKGFVQLIK